MASSSSSHKFIISVLVSVVMLWCNTGYAQNQPEEFISKASSCLHDKIYNRCNRAYRLTLSGNINVPPEATDTFCDGPCLDETHHALECIDDLLSDFVFFNRATVRDIRRVLNSACSSNGDRRGDFDVPSYLRDETSGIGEVQIKLWLGCVMALLCLYYTCWCSVGNVSLLG